MKSVRAGIGIYLSFINGLVFQVNRKSGLKIARKTNKTGKVLKPKAKQSETLYCITQHNTVIHNTTHQNTK